MADQFASDEKLDVVERLEEYAVDHGHTLPELALSWLAGVPSVGSVIAGATSPEQVRANAAATTRLGPDAGGARRGRRPGARRRLSRRRHITGVAAIDLAPGPLADVGRAPCARLLAALDDLTDDPPRALLLRAPDGVGAQEPRVPTPTGLRDPASLLAAFPAPTVAVWNGPAVGAGAELLLAADLRVIGPDASMAFPEVGAGELPCWGGTQRLTRAGAWRWRCACSWSVTRSTQWRWSAAGWRC